MSICKICSIHSIEPQESVVNSKLKIMIEKKKWNNEMGEDVRSEIKLITTVNLVKKLYDLICGKRFFFLLSWC